MPNTGRTDLPVLELNRNAILLRADNSGDMLTYESSLSGTSYIIDKNGNVMILESHGYFRAQWEDLMVICQELMTWILPEAERWEKA